MVEYSSNRSRRHSNALLFRDESESTVTYQLDKNSNDDVYNSATITVYPDTKFHNSYFAYTHTPIQSSHLKSTSVLYKSCKIDLVNNANIKEQDKIGSLDGKIFTEICTYCLQTNTDDHLLLKLTTDANSVYFLYRFVKDDNKWRQLGLMELLNFFVLYSEQMKDMEKRLVSEGLQKIIKEIVSDNIGHTKLLLDQIHYEVNSFIVSLDKKDSYQKGEITLLIGSEGIPSVDDQNKIFVNDETNKGEGKCIKSERYKLYKQHLQVQVGEELKKDDKFFLRLYLFDKKINLYDSPDGTGELTYLKYNPSNKYLYVYFLEEDPRPIMLCYENKSYIPLDLKNYFHKWVEAGDFEECHCNNHTENISKLLKVLSETVYFMNPVKIDHGLYRDKDHGTYIIQTFNHNKKEIDIKMGLYSWDLNCYRGYDHELNKPSYILGEISYNGNKLFKDYEEYNKLTSKNNVFPDKITVYYYIYDGNHEYPLLIELKYENYGTYSTYSSEYYKLTSKDPLKKWTKIDESSEGSDKIFIGTVKRIENEMKQEMEKMTESTASEESFEINEMETMSSGKEEKIKYVLESKMDEIRGELKIKYTMTEDNLIMSPNKCTKNNTGAIAGSVTALGLVGTGSGILIYKYQAIIVSYLRSLFN